VDRNRVAEFVLLLVMPVERAAAVIGDFLEELEGRGGFWFWSSVLRIVTARVASDFVRRPFSVLAIGIAGCVRIIVPALVLVFIASSFAHGRAWVLNCVVVIPMLGWYIRCGMWLGRYRPKLAAASCVAVILLGWVWILMVVVPKLPHPPDLALGGVHDLLLISGALWARYRDVRQTWRAARG